MDDELAKYNLTDEEKFVVDRLAEMKVDYEKSRRKLNDCIPMLKAAFEVKGIWESEGHNRDCEIVWYNQHNWAGQGFDIKIMLGKDDKVRDTYKALRPLKFNSPVIFKSFIMDKENGIVGANYRCKISDRSLELRIYVEKSRLCNRVKTGEKTVDVFEMVCDDSQEGVEQLDEGMKVLLTEESHG